MLLKSIRRQVFLVKQPSRLRALPPRSVLHQSLTTLVSPSTKSGFWRKSVVVGKWCGIILGSTAVGVTLIGSGILLHDAFTYNDKHIHNVPLSPLLFDGKTGGPKNLPIVGNFLRDDEDEEMRAIAKKPRLVVVGGGWGVCHSILIILPYLLNQQGVGLLNTLSKGNYKVVVVSPETFTTFTPLLPCRFVAVLVGMIVLIPRGFSCCRWYSPGPHVD